MAYQPKSYRKFLATGVAAAMVATAVSPVAGVSAAEVKFNDINNVKSWAGDAIEYLVENGIIQGYEDGTFRPMAALTRGEIAKIIAVAFDLDVDTSVKTTFSDAANHWSSPYIAAIQAELPGVIDGFPDGTFKPNATITREQLAKIVVEAYELEEDEGAIVPTFSDVTGWASEYIYTLASLGIVQGVQGNKFDRSGNVTRAQAAVFVHRTEVEEARIEVPRNVSVWDGTVKSVEATTNFVNSSDDNQYLEFTVNGGVKVTRAQLNEAGYSVQFGADQPVFGAAASNNTSPTGLLSAGRLDTTASAGIYNKFNYKVTVTKDGETFETSMKEVKVVNKLATASAINKFDLRLRNSDASTGDMVKLSNFTVPTGDTLYVTDVVGQSFSGGIEQRISHLEFTSSNPFVAEVTSTGGVITANRAGTTVITIKSGNATKEFTLTVVNEARRANSATVSTNSLKMGNGTGIVAPLKLTVLDQWGNPWKGAVSSILEGTTAINTAAGTNIANLTIGNTNGKGEATIQVAGTGAVGNGNINFVRNNNILMQSVALEVSTASVVSERRLELNDPSKTFELDLNPEQSKATVELVYNQYATGNVFLGATPAASASTLASSSDTFTVRVENPTGKNVVSSAVVTTTVANNGVITVNRGTDTGTATIEIVKGGVVVARQTVTTVDTRPTIAAASFKASEMSVSSTASATLAFTTLIDASTISFTGVGGQGAPQIAPDGTIYLVHKDGTAHQSIELGRLVAVRESGTINSGPTVGSGNVFVGNAGSDGKVSVGIIRRGESTPFATMTITVKN